LLFQHIVNAEQVVVIVIEIIIVEKFCHIFNDPFFVTLKKMFTHLVNFHYFFHIFHLII
jgi:hypothetical protein